MENIRKLQDGVFTIYAMVDSVYRLEEGLPGNISIDEVKESLTSLGLNADEILFHTHPYKAMQQICIAVANLELSDEALERYAKGV